jgi:hypothetical protein
MAANKARIAQPPATNDRTSEVQMNLAYAQQVAATVKARRKAELQRRMTELKSLPVTHPVDLALRDDLLEHCRAELKTLDDE